ncbi:hypothetical protein L1049_003062 [Liquidambar formosana]|uniref:Uncharacterized protein n=1 Tax=Liquidambar formosana TaxID=63359 RepID=A0AAP0R7V8_LIQFO
MRPTNNSTAPAAAVDGGIQRWNSPIPYLFGGLALMLGLIAVALLILACSYRRHTSNEGEEKPAKPMNMQLDNEPKIVVIMAGDDNPTYLAKPVSSTHQVQQV